VELRRVEPGATLADDREVLSGLAPGESVVVKPPAELADGARVATGAK
jgi:multidrug efflux pump subunit AcrA (membrane-fusion protein)